MRSQSSEPVYTGHPVSLDVRDADLHDVFRLFADISGMNVVVRPGVGGRVNFTLNEVPWDKALDEILSANGLTYSLNGNVLRIGRIADFLAEARALSELRQARLGEEAPDVGPLVVHQHFHEKVNLISQEFKGPVEQAVQAVTLQGSPVNRLNTERITRSFNVVLSSPVSEELKTALQELHEVVGEVVRKIPPGHADEAESAANALEVLSGQAVAKRPIKEVVLASGNRLLDIAKGINATVNLPASLARIADLLGLSGLF
jgi:type II secretory pathway component GspD/PulD (secretin)